MCLLDTAQHNYKTIYTMNVMTWFTDDNNKHAQDENGYSLSIKKILKRLNDLESIVQEQENLLAEQIVIIKTDYDKNRKLECIVEEQVITIKSNNERICMLERIVEEHVESLVENIIAVERNVEEQRELLDETIDKIIIDHEKINTIVSTVSKHEKSEEIIFETKDFEIDGVLYLKFTDDREIYDRETGEFLGTYNEKTKSIDHCKTKEHLGTYVINDNNKHAQDDKENALSIKKRLNYLEIIVQEHKNLLTEHTVIIETNNEKNCVLQHIVAEQKQILEETNDVIKVELNKVNIVEDKIDYLQLEVYKNQVTWAVVCIITDVLGKSRMDCANGEPFFRKLKYDSVIPFLEKIAHIIDVKWNVDEFIKITDELFQKVVFVGVKDRWLDCEVSSLKLLEFLNNSSCKVRKMFVIEEKILRSYVLLKPLMKTVYESYLDGNFKQLIYC